MSHVEKTVFISYRRATSAGWALAISQRLTNHGFDVFFDFQSLASGDFEGVIIENIRARAHFLVLLTPSALERVGEPGDWLRREIEAALEHRRNIVPLMLEGFNFATPSIGTHLTGTLAPLKSYNGLFVPLEYFNEAMDRLVTTYLNVALTQVRHPASVVATEAAKTQQVAAKAAPRVTVEELTAERWFERAFDATDIETKIAFYTEAIRLKPDFYEAFKNRASARHFQGDLDGAVGDLVVAVRLKPDDPVTFSNLGAVRRDQGDLDGAVAAYSEAIRLRPDHPIAFIHRGDVRGEQGDLDGAMADYSEAIRLGPHISGFYNYRGIARHEQGDLDGALADYTDAIRLEPDRSDTFKNRGNARRDKGDLDGAVADYSEAIWLRPHISSFYNYRGIARHEQGDLDGALTDFAEAIRLQPDDPAVYRSRGVAHHTKGDYSAAILDYQKYLDLGGGKREGDQVKIEELIRMLRRKEP